MLSRFIKFGLIGLSGLFVSLFFIWLFVEFAHLDKYLAWVLGTIIAIFSNYILNSFFTFPDRKTASGKEWRRRLALYFFMTLISVLINYLFYTAFLALKVHYLIAATAGIIISGALNFYFSVLWVWKEKTKI